jgi:hypothetical protein
MLMFLVAKFQARESNEKNKTVEENSKDNQYEDKVCFLFSNDIVC